MRALLRQFRRAPGRIIASVFALALAVGAIGILAVPTVSEGTLHEAVERDGLADIIVNTSPLDAEQADTIAELDGVAAAEREVSVAVDLDGFTDARMIGLDFEEQTMDLVQLAAGRLPRAPDEVVAGPGLANPGQQLLIDGEPFDVVGVGGTVWWAADDVVYAPFDTAIGYTAEGGSNRLVITAVDDGIDELRRISDEVRTVLAADGDTFTTFPAYLPDGSTPIDQDIDQISTLIGMLGIVAGLVAMVLLASTTNTLISERTREVAVMRALGGRQRPLRRRLRRIAIGITGISLVIGLPLGIFISNYVATMVLEEFVGVSPAFAIDWYVVGGSVVGMLLGARLVAARAARRVTKLPLAEALRDREGLPYGRRFTHRLMSRLPTGGLSSRLALRSSVHRPGRTVAVIAQIAAAVGAAFLIPSLTASVNDFNSATFGSWNWESQTFTLDPGLPIDATLVDDSEDAETGINALGELEDWEMDVWGLDPASEMFSPTLVEGEWLGDGGVVVSDGFTQRTDLAVGDAVTLDLASGPIETEIVGTVDDYARSVYVDREELASYLGSPGGANLVWSFEERPALDIGVTSSTETMSAAIEESGAGRDAVAMIFGAIGIIVAGVASLAVVSSMTVSLYERRHEFAAMQAVGARRRRLHGLLVRELLPIGAIGIAAGLGLGALGTQLIIGSFESANAIDIGVRYAVNVIPLVAAGAFVVLIMLARVIVRTAARRPVAVTLRGAA